MQKTYFIMRRIKNEEAAEKETAASMFVVANCFFIMVIIP